jgi:nicotinamide-nucleotide amidase
MPFKVMDPVRVQVLTIGDELLAGDIVDTNEAFFARRCRELGFEVWQARAVRDRIEDIVEALHECSQRVDIVLISGGLGPTSDDLTTLAVAKSMGLELERSRAAEEHLEAFFRARGRQMTANNLKQADFPKGAQLLENPNGTALGFALNWPDRALWCAVMPGVPREMKPMFENEVVPRAIERFASRLNHCERRVYRTMGIGESALAHEIAADLRAETLQSRGVAEELVVHYRAHPPEVLLTLELASTGEGAESRAIAQRTQRDPGNWTVIDHIVRTKLGQYVYAIDEGELAEQVHGMLRESGKTVAVAESCTGGLVGKVLSDLGGASSFFLGGVIAYANAIKEKLLHVTPEILMEHGAVSSQCAQAMAMGVRHSFGATFGLATTGIAGPEGGVAGKPVGTVFVALAGPNGVVVQRLQLSGHRERIRNDAALWALRVLRDSFQRAPRWLG